MINTSIEKITKKEINNLKREVAKETGLFMKDIEIISFSDLHIEYIYYRNQYDRVKNNKHYGSMVR